MKSSLVSTGLKKLAAAEGIILMWQLRSSIRSSLCDTRIPINTFISVLLFKLLLLVIGHRHMIRCSSTQNEALAIQGRTPLCFVEHGLAWTHKEPQELL